jgi:LPXTG-site transpeptidase (sortase) family protein
MRNRRWLIWLGSALMIGGAAFLACYWWTVHERTVAQQRAKVWLDRTMASHRPALAPTPAPAPPLRRGDVVGELEIPRLQVSVMVFEGDDAGILKQGAGHIPGTALPAGSGNIGIAAHRDTYFRPLRAIRANDVISVKTLAGTSRYAVTETEIVRPSDVGVLERAPGRDLTLVTCYPFFYVGSAPERFIVHARKIG